MRFAPSLPRTVARIHCLSLPKRAGIFRSLHSSARLTETQTPACAGGIHGNATDFPESGLAYTQCK
jgi:hypothetical protein